jgi:hypothetical protein
MVEENEERIADKEAKAYNKDRKLDVELSNKNPDSVADFNRRAHYSADNYYESRDGQESEKTMREE